MGVLYVILLIIVTPIVFIKKYNENHKGELELILLKVLGAVLAVMLTIIVLLKEVIQELLNRISKKIAVVERRNRK